MIPYVKSSHPAIRGVYDKRFAENGEAATMVGMEV
jgi:hypothetical protein